MSNSKPLPERAGCCRVRFRADLPTQYLEWDKAMGRLVARLGRKPIDARELVRAEEQKQQRDNYEFMSQLVPTAPEEAALRVADPSGSPEEQLIRAEEEQAADQAAQTEIDRLSKAMDPADFKLLCMHFGLRGEPPMSSRDIATVLNEPDSTVRYKIKSAVNSARSVLRVGQ